jgi:histidine triad (HIT) family protein
MPTIFERLISGELPCAKVYEDKWVFAFMDVGPVNDGHVLVVTKQPYETILEVDDESAKALILATKKIAQVVQDTFNPAGITLLQTNKPAGWQTVPHVHIHVIPRFENDGVDLIWPRKEPSMEHLQKLADKITVQMVVSKK